MCIDGVKTALRSWQLASVRFSMTEGSRRAASDRLKVKSRGKTEGFKMLTLRQPSVCTAKGS